MAETKKGYIIKGLRKGAVAYFEGNERRVGISSFSNVQTVTLTDSIYRAEVFETRAKATAKMKNNSVYYKFDQGEKLSDPHRVEVVEVELYPSISCSFDEIGSAVKVSYRTYYVMSEASVVSKEDAFEKAKENEMESAEKHVANLKAQLAEAERYVSLVRGVQFKG